MSLVKYILRLTRGGQDDLRQIHAVVAETRSSEIADLLIDQLIEQVKTLETLPERGAVPRELIDLGKDKYRQVFYQTYRIFYRIEGHDVVIAAVLDGRRDIVTILKRRLLIL